MSSFWTTCQKARQCIVASPETAPLNESKVWSTVLPVEEILQRHFDTAPHDVLRSATIQSPQCVCVCTGIERLERRQLLTATTTYGLDFLRHQDLYVPGGATGLDATSLAEEGFAVVTSAVLFCE